ncbi:MULTISPECIES: DUF5420 family protein [Pasteurellaceae]|uniref:DUF5420 family protein n=1 Tax=Pasteurella atlantica TaxID=2827233 RepID=A0AAW8CI17_9PAST|nr:DUF5420 family protein [Pasteurella atlantica]MBR0573704.1 DUF5420 family protein [Pasteurella atlantica]MDP8039661.1 DUF5420 family protein [Pasteurella atlantica]MDP8041752.1 DUF5420 family protein [Pasteurella atlantica]MDP8043974.1 DUF5420 family protein [Pasteurella atlantica]MDP8045952.1 DUF5420 family protein [Pasteurella atlantica]
MEYKYFKGDLEKEPLKKLNDNWLETRKSRNESLQKVVDTIPFYDGWAGGEDYICGIVCDKNNPLFETIKHDASYKIKPLNDNKKEFIVSPDKRYKKGKELASKIDEIRKILKKHSCFRDFMLRELKLPSSTLGRATAYFSSIGVVNKTLLLEIPFVDGKQPSSIPDFLTEIKESEFLAIQGK